MWDLADTTTLGVKSDLERDPAVLADRIETRAQEYFSECVGADPDAPRPWLVQGATVRQSALTYHLLSETVMHGYDIAQAAGRKWRIEPAHAVMALGRFIVPIIQASILGHWSTAPRRPVSRRLTTSASGEEIASILSSTMDRSESKDRLLTGSTVTSRPTPWHSSWWSGPGRVSGVRSARASCSPGAANRGWDRSSGTSCAIPRARSGVPFSA